MHHIPEQAHHTCQCSHEMVAYLSRGALTALVWALLTAFVTPHRLNWPQLYEAKGRVAGAPLVQLVNSAPATCMLQDPHCTSGPLTCQYVMHAGHESIRRSSGQV